MPFKITVLQKMANPHLAESYCLAGTSVCPCPMFQEGQEFVTNEDKPEGFCGWAWNDIEKYIIIFRAGGNMTDTFQWMRDRNTVIACCTDGIRPVVFKIEKIEG
ncbi:MAG TPA: TIGR04076 family protein [Phototrophicaceae bacterium]|nr:TIGR04076 family protein [Phototrophicaceae bacterium]